MLANEDSTVSVLLKTSRGLKHQDLPALATAIAVSVLLKTSRGLKPPEQVIFDLKRFSFSALEDEPWIEARPSTPQWTSKQSFSALEDEPWIEAVAFHRAAPLPRKVSVLLKTSRGLKPIKSMSSRSRPQRFSALEDEPWIEAASLVSLEATCTKSFSALEDEPWIEATAPSTKTSAPQSFSALEDEPWIEAMPPHRTYVEPYLFQCS